MSCPTIQKNGILCNRPIKLGSCCGYHRTYKNYKKLNEEYKLYKKNRVKLDKLPLRLESIRRIERGPIAIIVPYRDNPEQNRAEQLKKFIDYYHDYIPNLDIYIIEQSEGKKFNRGILLNIGFKIASERNENYKRYIFHDVDLLSPKELRKVYTWNLRMNFPVHIASLWREKYNFSSFLGGIISFNYSDFEDVNGFPNCFFGWGGEDDALYNRLVAKDFPVMYIDTNKNIEIKGMEHPQSKEDNKEKKENILRDLKNWKNDGLNNLDKCYSLISEKKLKYDNVKIIKVNV